MFFSKQPHALRSKKSFNCSWDVVTYPSVEDDGQDPVVWRYIITWNETLYQSDNSKGWEAYKTNDDA